MRLALLFLMFLMSLGANANIVMFPEQIIVVSVNGVEHESHFFARETLLDFTTGDHVVVLKYQDLFEGDDDHTKVTSKPFVVLFSLDGALEANEQLIVTTPNFDELRQAKAFAKRPKIKLQTQRGDEIASVSQSLINFNAQGKFAQLANTTKLAVLNDKVSATGKISNEPNSLHIKCNDKAQLNDQVSKLEQLKCLWSGANKLEQQAFLDFALAKRQPSTLKAIK